MAVMILMIIFLSVSSSISGSSARKKIPPPNLTNENPSSSLPTQNNKPFTPPQDELTLIPSLSASEAEFSLTSQLELPAPPFLMWASPLPPANQSGTTGLSSHANQAGQNNTMLAPTSKPTNLSVAPSPPREGELTSVPSLPSSQAELRLTILPELSEQTLELPIPPSPVRASSIPQPTHQSDTTSLSAHTTQEVQDNIITVPQPVNEIQTTDTACPSDHANPPPRLFPVYELPLQSPTQRDQFRTSPQNFHSPEHTSQPSYLPITVPSYQRNAFMAIEGGQRENEYHRMDRLSKCVLGYFFAGGLSYTSSWSQRPTLSISIYIQCFLNQVAFSLFLLAHLVFPRTNPLIAFIMDRLSFSLIVLSGYLATMPMYPPYLAVIMLLVVVMVYIFFRFRG